MSPTSRSDVGSAANGNAKGVEDLLLWVLEGLSGTGEPIHRSISIADYKRQINAAVMNYENFY